MNSCDNFIFRITIVHENSITGLQAVGVLKRLAKRLATKLGLDISPWQFYTRAWKFDWLQNPELWEAAVAMSAEADMIIISTGGHSALPATVRCWIESVLPRRQRRPMALVALLDDRGEASLAALPPARYLRQLARRYGVGFFCNLNDQSKQIELGIDSLLFRFDQGLQKAALN
jgi:hypothetical protein